MHKSIVLLPALLFVCLHAAAQPLDVVDATTPPFDPENLISSVFLGSGVEVLNITYNGAPQAAGYFTGGAGAVGIERGIVLTTGRASSGPGGVGANGVGDDLALVDNLSTAFDADLAAQIPGAVLRNVAVYEITFIPTADTLRFNYVFGSEEYPEFACSPFNDVFGFFIQGPGYPTPTNIARIPGTTLPVTINNLHPDNSQPGFNCPPVNEQFYNDNNFTTTQPCYDGYTDVFTAEAVVQPCGVYTIKLAIADVTDEAYDSGVFLEAKSFGVGSIQVQLSTSSVEDVVAEGCATGAITFTLPNPQPLPYPIDFTVFGTAVNGVDYDSIPRNLVIPPGQTTLVVPIRAIEDGLTEGQEFIAFDVQRDPCNRDTILIFLRDNTLLPPALPTDTTFCTPASPLTLDGTSPTPLPDPPAFTNQTPLPVTPEETPVFSDITTTGVAPKTLGPGVLRSVCMNVTHPWVDDLDIYLIAPNGQFLELTTDNGADGNNYTNTCFAPDAGTRISFPGPAAPAAAAPFTGNWLPEGPFGDLWGAPANGLWQLRLFDDSKGFTGTLLDWTITFEPVYKINYQWSPVAGVDCPTCPVATITPPPGATIYVVQATDSYGCTASDSIEISVVDSLAAPQVACFNPALDSVTFVWPPVSGAVGYEVNVNGGGWMPVGADTFFVVRNIAVPFTSTEIQVRPLSGPANCPVGTGAAQCVNCTPPSVMVAVDSADCFGQPTGVVRLGAMGGQPPYDFSLNGQTSVTGIFPGLAGGAYPFTVTDALGCPQTGATTVPEPPVLTLDLQLIDTIRCHGAMEADLTGVAVGGNGGYQFVWSGGQTGPALGDQPAGTYRLEVSDAKGCRAADSLAVAQPPRLSLTTVSTPAPCAGAAGGTATVQHTGGTGAVAFIWSNGKTDPTIDKLLPGPYTVTATDANGCPAVDTVVVGSPPALVLALTGTPATCALGADGSASITVSGGTGPYAYVWSDALNQRDSVARGLSAGSYFVTVTDATGCTATGLALVVEPPPMLLELDPTELDCTGDSTASVLASVQGGTPPFAYLWSTGARAPGIDSLGEGSYTLTVTDNNGCTIGATVFIFGLDTIEVQALVTPVACYGEASGGISLTLGGGAGEVTVSWSGPTGSLSGLVLDSLPAGDYTYVATDTNNCFVTAVLTVPQPEQPLAIGLPVVSDTLCFGARDGRALNQPSGGTPPYSWLWSTGATGTELNNLGPGTYGLTLTDANGCSATGETKVIEQGELNVDLVARDASCFGRRDGQAEVNAARYGNQPAALTLFQIRWSTVPTQTGPVAAGLPGGQWHSVTLTDAQSCSTTDSVFIDQPGPVGVVVQEIDSVSCPGGADGRIAMQGQGGIPPYSYDWSPVAGVQVDSLASGLPAGIYRVSVTDARGCTGVTPVVVPAPAPISVQVAVTHVACFGERTGALFASPSGGTGPYTIRWEDGSTQPGLAQLAAGAYRYTVTDSKNCLHIDSAAVDQPRDSLQGTAQGVSPKCFGGYEGRIILQATGGTPPYRYALNDGAFNGSSVQISLGAGTYLPSIRDKNGCLLTLPPVILDEPDPLAVSLGPDFSIPYGADTQLIATVLNNQGPVAFAWRPAEAQWLGCLDCPDPSVTGLAFDRYFEVHIVDSAGCRAEDQLRIQVLKTRKVFVPTGFSPDGDGNNDRLLVHGQSDTRVLQFSVYDRWGEQVYLGRDFFLNDPDQGWDGYFRGRPGDPGVYIWVLEVAYADGVREVFKGDVVLVR